MPQLDVSTFTSQLFWLAICFFMMLFIMKHFIVPKIVETIEQRKNKIDGYLEKAASLKEQAEQTLEKYQAKMKEAEAKADEALVNASNEMNDFIAQKQQELQKDLNKKIQRAEKQILEVKNEARKEISSVAENLVALILNKIDIQNIEKKEIKKFVSTQLKQD